MTKLCVECQHYASYWDTCERDGAHRHLVTGIRLASGRRAADERYPPHLLVRLASGDYAHTPCGKDGKFWTAKEDTKC